ncbi:MAG: hypothetical protein COZ31_09040 [Nitrospirae bacterium CG_4_10_14_3_um_filter_44_29]|nr:hypothetical protein [Nitrospirota bacterium]OIO31274.1 MAG: hypothetical protein AUJ60_01765 [Nitrospirae bacterium CG1_02_44_142]PIV40344.1 MAG: hypothetical protein COS28_09330 [Nitrospirae bacterium CG02_land_8_20_14_3_00_44_33]PIV67596.1 MAG: hypothetical protein COS10_00300 [Nitrospirae bacterium CG01_land_8_20_14_3_00_44_22]PIW90738.1 MAG: hypothetical protein COZ93_00500 [Nitrospirae bacterium CG_4_8_14_3_um_filter_44_28]PIX87704.1 MAG: hypothetical protein COZ31_09040 [Nitrospirae 
MKKYISLLFFFICFFFLRYAYGFDIKGLQPVAPYGVFSTFSADSPQKGKSAFGVGIEKSIAPDFFRYLLQYAYGVTDKVELITTAPYVDGWNEAKSGFEDIALGVKHRVIEETKYTPAVAYMVNVSAPSGEGVFSTDGRAGAGLIVSKRVGPVSGHANIFYEKAGSSKLEDEINFATGFDFSAAHDFKLLAEIYGRKSHYSAALDDLEGRFGYRFMTTDYLYTTIGIGVDLKNRSPEYRLMLSITAVLPVEKKKIKKVYEEDK